MAITRAIPTIDADPAEAAAWFYGAETAGPVIEIPQRWREVPPTRGVAIADGWRGYVQRLGEYRFWLRWNGEAHPITLGGYRVRADRSIALAFATGADEAALRGWLATRPDL